MRELPILFSGSMVRALLAGTKTQTRRVLKVDPPTGAQRVIRPFRDKRLQWAATDPHDKQGQILLGEARRCPYGPGDTLWVREAFSYAREHDGVTQIGPCWFWADGNPPAGDWTSPKPSIHMPRWASRITLEVTGVRVERLQDISESDAIAEGIDPVRFGAAKPRWRHYFSKAADEARAYADAWEFASNSYGSLWESINGPGSWDANPWVWVIMFRRIG